MTKARRKGLSKPKLTLLDRLPKNRLEWLKKVLFLTERSIGKSHNPTLVEQAKRIRAEIETLEK